MSIRNPFRPLFDDPEVGAQAQSTEKKKAPRYKVHPDKAAEFFADPNTNAYHADEAAQDWIKAYKVTSESGNTNPKGLNNRLQLALREHKKWSDDRDIQPLSLSKEVRHDRRMEGISSNLDNWGNLFSDEGFNKEIERRGLTTSYNELIDRGMDEQQVRGNLRRKLFTKDLSGQNDALSQARVSQHILGLEDQSDEAYVSGAQSWVEGKRKYRDEISNARKSAAETFFKRKVAVDWGLEAQKKVSPEAADAYLKSHNGFKKQYGDIVPVVRDLVDNMKAEGARGLFEETEEVNVNWGKIMELYGDNRRDDFLYVLGKVSEQEEVNVDGFIARNAKGMSRTVERIAKAGMRLIDQVKTEASGVSNESLRDRQWNQFQADIGDLKGHVARIEASNSFEKIANFTTASLPYMVFAATGVGTGLIAATEAQGFSENMRAENPNLTYEESMRVALPAGAVYAGIEKLQVGGLLGKFPGMQGVVNKLTSGTSLGSWARRVAATTLYEYGQETFQDAVEPLSRDIANQFKAEVPEGDWSTFEVVSKDRLLGVIGLSVLGGTGQWARDRFTQLEVKEELQDKFSLQLTGATVEEANEIAEMAEKDPDAALQQYKKKVFSKSIEERKEISEAAVKSAEDAVATGVLDGLPVVTSHDPATGKRYEGGGFVVDFKDGTKKTVESREEAQIAIDQRMEENFLDSAKAVRDRMDNLLETSEGDNKAEIAKPRTFQELADLGVETVERLKEAVAVSFMQRGEAVPENIDLNNYTEQGSVTLRRKMAGFAVRLAKDNMTLPSTVDEEFSEGFLRLIVEKGETTFDEVKTMLDEFGAIAGIDMTQGYDVDPNRAVIEGFSKFAKAYMLQGDHKSIPKSSQAWYRKAWRVLENPDSVPAPLRAFAELVTKLLRSVFDVAQAIKSQKQDGKGINPELESLAMRALGLNEQQIAEEAQAQYEQELQEELGLDPETDADPTFSIGKTTVTPNADTKTYPTKDGGVVGPASFSITAHHGTPHKVGKFSTEKIGTGEGAQAYGWGLYFAESQEVAQIYKDDLSGTYVDGEKITAEDHYIEGLDNLASLAIVARGGNIYKAIEYAKTISPDIARQLEDFDSSRITKGGGSLYTVDLNVEQDELLDWDKPLSEQSELVREGLYEHLLGGKDEDSQMLRQLYQEVSTELLGVFTDSAGGQIYNTLAGESANFKGLSQALAAAGIKGIRYLDGDSRLNGEGTSNYVIFDDADIKITEENGQVVDTSSPSFSITPLAIEQAGEILPGAEYVSPEEARWADIDGPVVIGAYHGSTHTIDRFSSERANRENDFGAGIYATTSPQDASANYAGEGPDLTARIEQITENLAQDIEHQFDEEGRQEVVDSLYRSLGDLRIASAEVADMSDADAAFEIANVIAKREMVGEGGRIYPLYLPMKNPAVIEEGGGTFFDPNGEIDTEALEFYREDSEAEIRDQYGLDEEASLDEYKDEVEERMRENAEEGGDLTNPIYEAAEETASLYGLDAQNFSEALDEAALEGAYLYQIEDAMRAKEELSYAESEDGGMIGVGEIINTFFQKLGYDGIIDRRANSKFGSERDSGKEMEGMDENTVHIIVPTDTANRPRSGFNPEVSFSITPKDEKMSEAVDQIFNGSSRFAEFSDKVRKKKEGILARYREQYAKADSESERAIIEVEALAQAEGLYMALPSRMKAIKSEIEEVAELIVERRSGVDSLKMKEDEGFRSVILPFKLPKAVSEFRIIKALRNNLTARGRLTREQHKIKMAAEATQLAELKEAEQVVARLRKQINKTVKGEVARDMLMRQAQEVATGDAKMDTLPKEIQPIVQEARDQVDRLSQKMIDSGIAKGDLAQVFERQMGNYLNRSYRRFTRPESWEKEVPQEARDAAKEYLRKELPADAYTPGISKDEQLDGYVDNLLQDSVSGSMMDSMTALLGQKHLGNLIGRKSIPKPIRDLWGEYKRLDENYLNSVRKMAGQVASHSILEDFKKDGLGDMIFEKPRKGYATQVTAEGNDALAPLDGYYVSEEMAQALKDFAEMGKKEIGTWLKWWLKFNSTAKVSKTIYNPTTHARNFFSNFGYVLANDNFFEYARSGKDSAVINFKEIFGFARTPEIEDRIRYYVRLGIMHQGAVSQEFKDILKDFSAGEVDIEEYSQKKLLKIAKAPLDVIQAAYQAEDDFHKIVAFESEKRKLAKHKKNWSQEKIDREAAQIIRDTMPDYSQVPTAVKALRRVPLIGTFTSFTAEVLRNNHNIIARAITEMKDPDLKVVGIRRMSFFMMAHAVPIALAAFLKEMFDVDDEEDEATRAIAAPWDKDSLLMYVGRSPSGDPKYANFSYTDPFSIFKTPFIISQREGLSATSITKGVWKGLEPFYGVEIGTKALMEAANNQDDLGRDISNDNDDVLTQARDRSIHVIKALEPGFLRTGERIKRAYTGEKTPSGKEFDLATEIGAVITGQRVTTVSRQDAVRYRTWDFTDDKRNASTNFNKAWRNKDADRDSLTEAVEEYRRDTQLAFEGYQDVLRAVSVLGLSDEEILAAGYDNPKTPSAQVAQSLLDAKVGETPIPQKKFSKSHLKEIREIEGREKLLRKLMPEAF